jgi:hypothetical protein
VWACARSNEIEISHGRVVAKTLNSFRCGGPWLHRLDDMMGIVGCGFRTYTRQYE